jgi:hypothetical protein
MNGTPSLVMTALVAWLVAGCVVPSLAQLELERPSACAESSECAEGFSCEDGFCRARSGPECRQGATSPCGSDVGECAKGTRVCGADGRFGPCVGAIEPSAEVCNTLDEDCDGDPDDGAKGDLCQLQLGVCRGSRLGCISGKIESACTAVSYGPEYQAVETLCDGKDNDCDGDTDEALTQACVNQKGVCLGAVQTCAMGAFAVCTSVTFSSFSAAFEPHESTCDGKDNDCDGKIDEWDLMNVSQSPVVASKSPAAAPIPGEGAVKAALVVYEEGAKIRSRRLEVDGTLGPSQIPSASVNAASLASAPALASDDVAMAATWIESQGGAINVMFAPLSASGLSTLASSGAASVFTGTPLRVHVSVDGAASRALILVEEASGRLVAIGVALSGSVSFTKELSASGATHARSAPAGSGAFSVVWEASNGIERALVAEGGTVSRLARVGSAGDGWPSVFSVAPGAPYAAKIYFLSKDPLAPSNSKIFVAECSASPDGCSAPVDFASTVSEAKMRALAFAARASFSQPVIAAWEQGEAPIAIHTYAVNGAAARSAELTASGNAQRPAPVILSTAARPLAVTLYDADVPATPDATQGEIQAARLCGP